MITKEIDEGFIHKITMSIKEWLKTTTSHTINSWQNNANSWTISIVTISTYNPRITHSFLLQLEPEGIFTLNNFGHRGPALHYENPNLNEQIINLIDNPAITIRK